MMYPFTRHCVKNVCEELPNLFFPFLSTLQPEEQLHESDVDDGKCNMFDCVTRCYCRIVLMMIRGYFGWYSRLGIITYIFMGAKMPCTRKVAASC